MNRVLALVEGRTEQTFVGAVLAPELSLRGVHLTASVIGKPGHKGGTRRWASVRRELLTALKQDQRRYCTTMFDYYALPKDWPAANEAKAKLFTEAAGVIEQAIQADICRELGDHFDQSRLIPYIQMHEFEALLFSETGVLAEVIQRPDLKGHFDAIIAECGEPEAIDDNPETAPSKRIATQASNYQKILHGAIGARRIGLSRMTQACPHFGEWIRRLEALGPQQAA